MAIIEADSCSAEHVAAAIADASNGDTLVVPAGSETWTDYVQCSKSLDFVGAGIDVTTIGRYGLLFNSGTDDWSVTGFTFDNQAYGNNNIQGIRVSDKIYTGPGCFAAGSKRFRIHHNKFKNFYNPAPPTTYNYFVIRMNGYCYGVIDNNIFYDCLGEVIYYAADNGPAWTRGGGLGGYENGTMFVEDNQYSTSGLHGWMYNPIDSASGARYVFRYNSIEDAVDAPLITCCECHGLCNNDSDNADVRGTYSVEIYGNIITKHDAESGECFKVRGGRGVICNNVLLTVGAGSFGTYQIRLQEHRAEPALYGACYDCGACEPVNPRTYAPDTELYPAHDQINNLYIWGNTKDGGALSAIYVDGQIAYRPAPNDDLQYVEEGIDYFESEMGGYTPYAYPHPLRGYGGGEVGKVVMVLLS